ENSELISDVLAGIPEYVAERNRMHEKRMRKLDGLRKDTPPPELWGPEDADLTLIHWGSTWGAAHEAIQNVEARGIRVNSLEFEMDTYKSEIKPTWCPGCGDFAVLRALQTAIHALQLEPWNILVVSGSDARATCHTSCRRTDSTRSTDGRCRSRRARSSRIR